MFLSMPTLALLCAADEGTTENLWIDCEILDYSYVCLCTLPEGRRGGVESDSNWGLVSDKQGLFTTGS